MLEVIVEAIGLIGFPKSCLKHTTKAFGTATYTVTISVDDKVMLTCDFPAKDITQERKFGCKITKTSKINIEVDCKHNRWYDPHEISTKEIKEIAKKLQLNSEETDVFLDYVSKKNLRKSGILILKVSRISSSAELKQFKLQTSEKKCLYTVADLEGLGIVSQILSSKMGLECPEWVNFLGSMGSILKIAEPISEVDPHAKLALSAAQVAFELFMSQKEHDEQVLGLIQVMANLYQMILDSNPLMKCQTLSQTINDLIALTRECAYFIAQYMKTGPVNAIFNADYMISKFEKQFFILKEIFFTGIMLSIGKMNT
ncbi:hypothetical protein BDQ17DRAFT_636677 [Cyathus striatus]|nr:hypothetical protein BDQ17DRAFT_636677 [Cyathus striatus]